MHFRPKVPPPALRPGKEQRNLPRLSPRLRRPEGLESAEGTK